MMNTTNKTALLEYRRAATQQASVVGLVIALHDTLVGDLRRAAEAMERNDIQGRCDQLIHGFKVLQQLDAMVDMENGGDTAVNLRRFYKHLRGQMLSAQFKLSSEVLKDLIRIVLEVRQAWQQIDSSPKESYRGPGDPITTSAFQSAADIAGEMRNPFSCLG